MFNITGTVGSNGKYLVTGMPVDTESHAVLKIAFENNTSGTISASLRAPMPSSPREAADCSYRVQAVRVSNF
jgi:hypothetical protein